jgi:hypothetical protein
LPLPVAPAVTVSQVALLTAVQLHPVAAVTAIAEVAAAEDTLVDVGAIVGAHVAPACVTVKVFPPTVSVPVRLAASVLAATV